jgi:hypothetical protein
MVRRAYAACQYDRSLKTTLTPIVTKLSPTCAIVNGELENLVFEPRKEFIVMVVLVAGNIPLMRMLNKDWYHTLMHTARVKSCWRSAPPPFLSPRRLSSS